MTTRRAVLRLSVLMSVTVSTACGSLGDPGDWDIDPDAFCATSGCVALTVETAIPRMLKGDTVRVYTRSDSGLASVVAWDVTCDVEMVPESQVPWTFLFGSDGACILIRGLAPGRVDVKATNPLPRSASTHLTVSDSSVITGIALSSYASPRFLGDLDKVPSTSMRVGDSVWVDAVLRDAAGRDYAGRPEGWTTSDA